MNIKRIFPIEINYMIRNIKKILWPKKLFVVPENKTTIYYLDAPSYGNLGDQAIAYAISTFIKNTRPNAQYIEIQEDMLPYYIHTLKKTIRKQDIICLTGGGNMGIAYPKYEALRRKVIKTFKNNRIIIFPQTIDYEKSSYGKKALEKSIKTYSSHHNLTLIARETISFNVMKANYINNNILLAPDIVLYLNDILIKQNLERDSIGLCLRDDKESMLSEEDKKYIEYIIGKQNVPIKKLSTMAPLDIGIIDATNRHQIISKKFNEFATCRLIITDRLHAMIFAKITKTPCIVFQNSNHKIKGVYAWLEGSKSYIKLINSTTELEQAISDVYMVDVSSVKDYMLDKFKYLIKEFVL